jgi:hypothetical protein
MAAYHCDKCCADLTDKENLREGFVCGVAEDWNLDQFGDTHAPCFLGLGGSYFETDPKIDEANPKDLLGLKKVPLHLLPAVARIFGAMAMKDGARKYGPYNWRTKKVKASIYIDAIERHMLAFLDGEDCAEDSGIHHLGHVIACCAILLDAKETGNLIDDRPITGVAAALMDQLKET